jgi:hypothetical protein
VIDDGLSEHAVKAVAAWFGLKGIDRLLGPTLDLYGDGLKNIAEAGNRNIKSIFERAINKIGKEIEEDGQISPRLFQHLVEGAPYCDDEIAQEYFAGIIASSRTRSGSDYLIHHSALINRLPTHQLRMHYFFYALFHNIYKQSDLLINRQLHRLPIRNPQAATPRTMPR